MKSIHKPENTQTFSAKELTYKEALAYSHNTQLAAYIVSAAKLGISYRMLIPGLFAEFSKNGKIWRIHKALTPINDSVAMSLVSYKNMCNRFLRDEGFPVPLQAVVQSCDEIQDFMKAHTLKNIVIKPVRGFGGGGVSILPHTDEEIDRAFTYAYDAALTDNNSRVLVEEFIQGRHFRILVLKDKVIAVAERMAPYIVGNGTSSIRDLVSNLNERYHQVNRPQIKIDDEEAVKALHLKGYTPDSIPTENERVTVRLNANMTSGGTVRECSSEIHSEYTKLAIDITKATGLTLAGIDLITPDITAPAQRYAVNEVNHNPGVRIHYMPDEGNVVDICTTIQQYILDNYKN